jgi:hypothetical protein
MVLAITIRAYRAKSLTPATDFFSSLSLIHINHELADHGDYWKSPIETHAGRNVMIAIGRTRWAIAEGYIPAYSHGAQPQLTSHETACLLNASDADAHISITIYYSDREPGGPYRVTVPARRTQHLRFNDLTDPEPIPRGTDYASVIESDVPIVVQHTRLDSRQADMALLSTLAFSD